MAEALTWSPDVAWVEGDGEMTVALLPDGPVTVLTGADAALEHMRGEFTVEALVERASRSRPEQADEMCAGIRDFVDGLRRSGLVVPVAEGTALT